MSALCILAAGKSLTLAATVFTLTWTHSVEKTAWQEDWALTPKGLVLTEARIKGSGAGMDPGEGAREVEGWWVWQPTTPPVSELVLASSGTTASGWQLCTGRGCIELGVQAEAPIVVRPCDPGK